MDLFASKLNSTGLSFIGHGKVKARQLDFLLKYLSGLKHWLSFYSIILVHLYVLIMDIAPFYSYNVIVHIILSNTVSIGNIICYTVQLQWTVTFAKWLCTIQ